MAVLCGGLDSVYGQSYLVFTGDPLPAEVEAEREYRSVQRAVADIGRIRAQLWSQGYLMASFDSLMIEGQKVRSDFHLGSRYRQEYSIEASDVVRSMVEMDQLTLIDLEAAEQISSQVLKRAGRMGHPFASTRLDLVSFEEATLQFALTLQEGPFIRLDSVVVRSEVDVAHHSLVRSIGVKEGMPYDAAVVAKVDERLARLPFVTLARPSEVVFADGSARLLVFLKERKADRVDAIVGFQPDESGQTIFTGQVDLALVNSLKRAETITLEWNRVRDATQELEIAIAYPFLFRSPFALDLGLDIYRLDSTFNEVRSRIGLGYALDNGDILRVFYRSATYNALGGAEVGEGDGEVGSQSRLYGAGIRRDRRDRPFNPKRGSMLDLEVSSGTKSFSQSEGVLSAPTDGESQGVENVEAEVDLQLFRPVGKRATVLVRLRGGSRTGRAVLAKEVFRLGGLRSLRGFDEQSVSATTFSIATAEYRFFTGEDSYFSAFFDQGLLEVNTVNGYRSDAPFGFGIGTSIATPTGIFSLNYALGSQQDEPIRFQTGKVHFGFVATF